MNHEEFEAHCALNERSENQESLRYAFGDKHTGKRQREYSREPFMPRIVDPDAESSLRPESESSDDHLIAFERVDLIVAGISLALLAAAALIYWG